MQKMQGNLRSRGQTPHVPHMRVRRRGRGLKRPDSDISRSGTNYFFIDSYMESELYPLYGLQNESCGNSGAGEDESDDAAYLLISSKISRAFILIGQVNRRFPLCIELQEREVCQTLLEGDMVAVSAPEGGELRHAAMLLELVRRYRQPLLVLPKGHEGSKRLSMVVSAGGEIIPKCTIIRGTHPEQNVICSAEELSALSFHASTDGVKLTCPSKENFTAEIIRYSEIFGLTEHNNRYRDRYND